MAQTQLNDRLEHLMSYSSELVFLCGTSPTRQSDLLASFLHQQSHNQTEVAYITPRLDKDVSDYRREISHQLLPQNTSVNRPLNEILAPLNQQQGQVLIAIYQAEQLNSAFLQELWQLVLQCRFAKNQLQLSVMLLGSPQWAMQCKRLLPETKNCKPLLISADQYKSQQGSSDLQRLIEQKRAAFAVRKQQQQKQQQKANVFTNTPGFKIVLAVFLCLLFALITNFFYPQSPHDLSEKLKSHASPESFSASEMQQISGAEMSQPNSLLVTDWATEVGKLAQQTVNAKLSFSLEVSEQLQRENTPKKKVVSSEQIVKGQQGAAEYQQQLSIEKQNAVAEQLAVKPQIEVSQPDITFAHDEQQLLDTTEGYVWQLAGMSDLQLLKAYLQRQKWQRDVLIYQTLRAQQPWFVAVYKTPYSTIAKARQAGQPKSAPQAFIKALSQIKKEIGVVAI